MLLSQRSGAVQLAGDLIATTYFAGGVDVHRMESVPADREQYIQVWLGSMEVLRLPGVVYYSGLSEAFVRRMQRRNIAFIGIDYDWSVSPNDFRFFLWRNVLRSNPGLRRVWFTDGRDVVVRRDPFQGMQPGRLHLGYDGDGATTGGHAGFASRLREAGFQALAERDVRVVNAGVLGGERGVLLEFLEELCAVMSSRVGPEKNVNMPCFNEVFYRLWEERSMVGHPVTSRFGSFVYNDADVWFIHN